MRHLGHSLIIHLLVVILAMPAHAAPPRRRPIPQGANAKPRIFKSDPRKRLIQPILPFVDVQANSSLNPAVSGVINNAINAGKATDSQTFTKITPSLLGAGGGGGGGKGSNAFNYNSGGGNRDGEGGGGDNASGDGGGERRPREGRGSQSGGAEAFPKWWPMCLFLDESISTEEGNRTVKGLIDDAAKCKVNLVVFPVTIKANYSDDPDIINKGSQGSCNIVPTLAEKASTSVCVHHQYSSDKMCGDPPTAQNPNPQVAGCAQLQAGAGARLRQRYTDPTDAANLAAQANETQEGAAGVAAPSIEDAGQCTKDIVAHEALGHSQMGMPNGESHGKGIGRPLPGGAEGTATGDWTEEGCAEMFQNGFDNSDQRWKYDRNRQNYYTKIEDPAKQWDLLGGGQLFKPPPGPPPPGRRKGDRPKGGPQQITYDEGAGPNPGSRSIGREGAGGSVAGGSPPAASPPAAASNDFPPVADVKHKRKPGESVNSILVENVKSPPEPKSVANDDAPVPQTVPAAPPPPPGGKGGSPQRITYDESAPKGRSGGDSGNSGIMRPSLPSPPGEAGGYSTTYDESAPKNGPSIGGGGGKTTIGYDESAPKNGASIGSSIIRMGSAVGEGAAAASAAASLPSASDKGSSLSAGIGSIKLSPGGFNGSSMSSDFFQSSNGTSSDDDEKKEEERRRRRAAGGERRRGPASLSEGAPGSRYRGGTP